MTKKRKLYCIFFSKSFPKEYIEEMFVPTLHLGIVR